MIIERDIKKYLINSTASIAEALGQISRNKSGFVLCLDNNGRLDGALTDGDFRRWISKVEEIDVSESVVVACNRDVTTAPDASNMETLADIFSERVSFVPLVDAEGRVTGVALERSKGGFEIDGRRIGENEPCYIIAEIGVNHNGSVSVAKELIDCAVEAQADSVKFQLRDLSSLYKGSSRPDHEAADLGTQYTLEVLQRANFSTEQMGEVLDYAQTRGITPLCTPWDLRSVAFLAAWGVPAYKIASADMTNHQLIRAVTATGKPLIVSTGMSNETEILETVTELRRAGGQFALLHCNSTYPTPFKDVHLRYLDRLSRVTGAIVGYSGHERGYAVPIAAVARGAKIVEKHITLDRNMVGNDHKVSLEPDQFTEMVAAIRNVEEALGGATPREPSVGEQMNREVLAKSLVAAEDIKSGRMIDQSMIAVQSPGTGLQPNRIRELVGRPANRDIAKGDFFFATDLLTNVSKARNYKFNRPWGVPVRYHDWKAIHQGLSMDFVEFHFSYKDLEADPGKFFDAEMPTGLVVHSPDLFENDHILNLAADDRQYREVSIAHLQRTIEVTRRLKKWFPNVSKVPLIASLGGMSRDEPVAAERLPELYDRVSDSLSHVDTEGVDILPQTLPPFPWYLGGQLYCNLFVEPEDTAEFSRSSGLKICFDVSHSKLAANHRGRRFEDYVDILGPVTGHLHIVDAAGVDSEGLQIGEGEIDFEALGRRLAELCPNVPFIPEIWQGHKNGGDGFWLALDRLEGLL